MGELGGVVGCGGASVFMKERFEVFLKLECGLDLSTHQQLTPRATRCFEVKC